MQNSLSSEDHNGVIFNLIRFHAASLVRIHSPENLDNFDRDFRRWVKSQFTTKTDTRKSGTDLICDKVAAQLVSSNLIHTIPRFKPDNNRQSDIEQQPDPPLELSKYYSTELHLYNSVAEAGPDPLAKFSRDGLVGETEVWLETLRQAAIAARCDFPVIITGETGTGKELIANSIHFNSMRSTKPCVTINCGALPEALTESELFGYRSGAFTSAAPNGRRGRIEVASGGTVILDEIAELTLRAQVALLRTLQTGELQKLGGIVIKADIRAIAISNKPLAPEIEAGRFRSDLFYRIAILCIHLPPLRDRKPDISLLADHFNMKFSRSYPCLAGKKISSAAHRKLKSYLWPGNARELENVIARALVLSENSDIEVEHILFEPISGIQDEASASLSQKLSELPDFNPYRISFDDLAIYLQENRGYLTTADYSRKFVCSETTARRHLEKLYQAGMLSRNGEKKGAHYILASSFRC